MQSTHGDDLYRYKDIKINFSSNIYSHADLSKLKKHLSERLYLIGNYPEPEPKEVAELIAKKEGISSEEVLVCNGATEAIYIIAAAFYGANSTIYQPTFCEYEVSCRAFSHNIYTQYDHIENNKKGLQLCWICNPNNPTGEVMDLEALKNRITSHPEQTFVIDQSYSHYTTKKLPRVNEMVKQENVILIHSLTKLFCIPGLRIGYITANKNLIRELRRFKQTWSVNAIAIEAAKFLFSNSDCLNLPDIHHYLSETKQLQTAIDSLEGYRTLPTKTNFFLTETTRGKASELKEFLAKEHHILIRDASNFRLLSDGYFRIATQAKEENEKLVEALKTFNN